jgi:hypothetical protein
MAEATTSKHESNYIKIAMVVLRVSPRAIHKDPSTRNHSVDSTITYTNWLRQNKYNNLPVPGNNKFHGVDFGY